MTAPATDTKAAERATTASADSAKEGIVDCDVHPAFADGLHDLAPYMSKSWRRRLGLEGGPAWAQGYQGSQLSLPTNGIFVNIKGVARDDASPDGQVPGSDPELTKRQLLDEHNIWRAILIGQHVLSIGAFADPDVSATVSSAYNDWMQERWLEYDRRFRGALVVPPQDPEAAVVEIDRVAGRPGIVAIMLPLHDIAMGERHYYPIYEAAERHGLPILVHPSGTENVFARAPRMALTPTYYLEYHNLLAQVHQSNVLSLVFHGVFERYPNLNVIVVEGGFMWAAELMYKTDREWLGLRDEVPWVKRPPSEYIREHIRFTTQPFPEPHDPKHLKTILEMVYAEETLLFSSDYPHWDFDNPHRALSGMGRELRRKISVDNPMELFGERLQ